MIFAGLVLGGAISVEELVSVVGNVAPQVVPDLISALVGGALQPGHKANVGYEIMDTFPYDGARLDAELRGNPKVYSLEMFFPVARGMEFVAQPIWDFVAREARDGKYLAGVFAVRFAGRSRGLLSMSRFAPTMCIEAYGLRSHKDSAGYLRRLERYCLDNGGMVHWGQHQDQLTDTDVRKYYGSDFATWHVQRAELIAAWLADAGLRTNPYGVGGCVFDNRLSARCGLSPPLRP